MKKLMLLLLASTSLQAIPYEDQIHNLRTKKSSPSGVYEAKLEKEEGIWHLTLENIPDNKRLQVASRNGAGTVDVNVDFLHVESGIMHSYIDFRDTDNYPLVFDNFSYGEEGEILIIDPDKKTVDAVKIIPHPLEAKANDGAQVALKLIEKNPTTFAYEITHLNPKEKVRLISKSESQWRDLEVEASGIGTITGILSPEFSKGRAFFEIAREVDSFYIEYEWGMPKKENPATHMTLTIKP
jgi:hypothetical protein